MKIIDVHTHAFPDELAEKAMSNLTKNYTKKYYHNGTISSLIELMDKAGIYKSVIQSIATKPDQALNILKWSLKIKSDRIEPFISIHPQTPNYKEILKMAKDNGIKGIKVHPHYQGFKADDENIFFLYEDFIKFDFIVFFHSGVDLAFLGYDNAAVWRILKVRKKFPEMKIILAHFGGYREWDKVAEFLAGEDFYFETSFVLQEAGEEVFKRILRKHSIDKILFGTDSPWTDPINSIKLINELKISNEEKEKIFYKNYERILNL